MEWREAAKRRGLCRRPASELTLVNMGDATPILRRSTDYNHNHHRLAADSLPGLKFKSRPTMPEPVPSPKSNGTADAAEAAPTADALAALSIDSKSDAAAATPTPSTPEADAGSDNDDDDEEENGAEGAAQAGGEKKKKKKKKAKSKKKKATQSDPPRVGLSKFFTNGVYPEGEIQEYKNESVPSLTRLPLFSRVREEGDKDS